MNFSLRSLRLAPLSLVAALALGATGCVVEAGIDGPAVVETSDVPQVGIDTDAVMQTAPGEGAGLFVETKSDGHWRIYTACDTKVSHSACHFDVIISSVDGLPLDNVTGTDLTDADDLSVQGDGSIHLLTATTLGLDGVEFDLDPGAVLEVDMLLDGDAQPTLVNWVSGGVVAPDGAPSNPVDFAPEAP